MKNACVTEVCTKKFHAKRLSLVPFRLVGDSIVVARCSLNRSFDKDVTKRNQCDFYCRPTSWSITDACVHYRYLYSTCCCDEAIFDALPDELKLVAKIEEL